jgi:hypothetical protein
MSMLYNRLDKQVRFYRQEFTGLPVPLPTEIFDPIYVDKNTSHDGSICRCRDNLQDNLNNRLKNDGSPMHIILTSVEPREIPGWNSSVLDFCFKLVPDPDYIGTDTDILEL